MRQTGEATYGGRIKVEMLRSAIRKKRMMKNKLLRTCVLLALLQMPSFAISATTYGGADCGKWTQVKSQTDRSWLLGFMSGINLQNEFITNDKSDPLAKVSTHQIWAWMDNYCQNNPLNTVVQGGFELLRELKKK